MPDVIDSHVSKQEPEASAHPVAVIDIGTNAIRMVIAQVFPSGEFEVLERLQRPIRLGKDTFSRGRIGAQSMRSVVAILRDFQEIMEEYRVEKVRAVATSSLRDAANADNVLDRIFLACRLNVEVIGIAEEGRLTVAAVREVVEDLSEVNEGKTLIVDVGGGSTILTMLEEGEIINSVGLRFGSVRILEMLSLQTEPPERVSEVLQQQIRTQIANIERSISLEECDTFVAVGGDVRFAARVVGRPTRSEKLFVVEKEQFRSLVRQCARHTPNQLARRYNLPFIDAETLLPALMTYWELLCHTSAERVIVSQVSMRDGLLLELARETTGQKDHDVLEGIIRAAEAIAKRYRVDLDHARLAAGIAIRLFDSLVADHGLGPRQRLLLQVAAILHEIGGFINSSAHHKHGYYIISNTEIFGLNRSETQIVAHVARYHRRSPPKPSHLDYMALSREQRVIVNKLAAILRIADALARGRISQPEQVEFHHEADELIITVRDVGNLVLQKRAIAAKCDMFEDVYGMKVRLQE